MSLPLIVSAVRTAVGKAPRGKLSATRPDDMVAFAMRAAIERTPGLRAEDLDDIYIGCAMPLNRFCSSGLQSIAFAADRIASGAAHTILAGGTESMSMIPMGGHKIAP